MAVGCRQLAFIETPGEYSVTGAKPPLAWLPWLPPACSLLASPQVLLGTHPPLLVNVGYSTGRIVKCDWS